MAYTELLSKEWCELIFEGRNKAYGAYTIRKSTGLRYAKALIIIVMVLLSMVGGFVWYNKYQYESMGEIKIGFSELSDLKAIAVNEFKVPKYKRVKSLVETQSPIVATEIVDKQLEKYSPLKEGTEMLVYGNDSLLVEEIKKTDSLAQKVLPVKEYSLLPTEVVEQMPEFPGGIKALMKWLDENLEYPEDFVKMKIQGDVEVSFAVDPNGNIVDPKVLNANDLNLEKIVLSTIKKMPKWKPGTWKGESVTVCITIPIRFQL